MAERAAFLVAEPRTTALRALNYDRAVEAIRHFGQQKGIDTIAHLARSIGRSYGSRFAGADCEPAHGISLLSQTAMFAAEPSTRYIREDSIPRVEAHRIHDGQVLVAGAGTLGETELFGRAIIADDRLTGRALGPHAVAIDFLEPNADRSLFAFAYLASRVGLRAIRSVSCGTKILALRLDMLGALPVPPSDSKTIARVAGLVTFRRKIRQP